MMVLKNLLLGSTVSIAAIVLAQPAAAAPWTRGFVVATYGFAFHYGGRPQAAKTDPGADCPHGSAEHFADEDNMRRALERQPWRSQADIATNNKPPGIEQARLPTYVRFYILGPRGVLSRLAQGHRNLCQSLRGVRSRPANSWMRPASLMATAMW
jgi:hypothetical protein